MSELYIRIKELLTEENPRKADDLMDEFEVWFTRELSDTLEMSPRQFLSSVGTIILDIPKYKYSEHEFFANANLINLLRNLGLSKEQVRTVMQEGANIKLRPEHIPEEIYRYYAGLGIDREQAYKKFIELMYSIDTTIPFDVIWDYVTHPTIKEQLNREQLMFDFAGNWYKMFKNF